MRRLFFVGLLALLAFSSFSLPTPAQAQNFYFGIEQGYRPPPPPPRHYHPHYRPHYPHPHMRPPHAVPLMVTPFGFGPPHRPVVRCHFERRFVETPYGMRRQRVKVCIED